MSLASVFGEYEAMYKEQMLQHTWGHLHPAVGYYEGKIRIAADCAGHSMLQWMIDGVKSNPWTERALSEFMCRLDLPESCGTVWDIDIGLMVREIEDFVEDGDERIGKSYLVHEVTRLRTTVALTPMKGKT